MSNKTLEVTQDDIHELSLVSELRDMWGCENAKDMEDTLVSNVYIAKFDYQTGGPGYSGILYVLVGEALGQPIEVIRDASGKLYAI